MNCINLAFLSLCFIIVMKMVIDAGFNCISVVCDNHHVNRYFYAPATLGNGTFSSCVKNPADTGKELFLLTDPTHNLKNLNNHFQGKKNFTIPQSDLNTLISPNLQHIEDLYKIVSQASLRMAHKPTNAALDPTNVHRMSAKHIS